MAALSLGVLGRSAALAWLLAATGAAAQPRVTAPPPAGVAAEAQRAVGACLATGRANDPAHARGCLERQRAVLEPRLDRALQALAAAQRADRRAAFAGVQAAWTEYRDRSCDFAGSSPEAGPAAVADRAACLLEFTVARIEELEDALRPATAPAPRR